jgi:Flp pilus assembly protein TadB
MNNELKDFWKDEKKVKRVEESILKEEKEKIQNKVFKVNKETEVKLKFKEYTKVENEEYKPTYLIIQIILNAILFSLSVYFDTFGFIVIMLINFCLIWIYSLMSVLKNDFKKENNKTIWLIALIFLPFITPYIYHDFKEIQIIK